MYVSVCVLIYTLPICSLFIYLIIYPFPSSFTSSSLPVSLQLFLHFYIFLSLFHQWILHHDLSFCFLPFCHTSPKLLTWNVTESCMNFKQYLKNFKFIYFIFFLRKTVHKLRLARSSRQSHALKCALEYIQLRYAGHSGQIWPVHLIFRFFSSFHAAYGALCSLPCLFSFAQKWIVCS